MHAYMPNLKWCFALRIFVDQSVSPDSSSETTVIFVFGACCTTVLVGIVNIGA